MASLVDLYGTKIKALFDRVEAKDYRDIAGLIKSGADVIPKHCTYRKIMSDKAFRYVQLVLSGEAEALALLQRYCSG